MLPEQKAGTNGAAECGRAQLGRRASARLSGEDREHGVRGFRRDHCGLGGRRRSWALHAFRRFDSDGRHILTTTCGTTASQGVPYRMTTKIQRSTLDPRPSTLAPQPAPSRRTVVMFRIVDGALSARSIAAPVIFDWPIVFSDDQKYSRPCTRNSSIPLPRLMRRAHASFVGGALTNPTYSAGAFECSTESEKGCSAHTAASSAGVRTNVSTS